MSTHAPQLSDDEKRALYRDGYIIVKKAVSDDLVDAALKRIKAAKKGESLSGTEEMTNLVNESTVTPILNDAMGQFDPPIACQVGVRKRSDPGEHFNNLGYREKDQPYFAAESHMDGLCTIAVPQDVQEGTEDEIYHHYVASGPKGDLGRSPEVLGHNMVPLFEDPDMTLGMGSFTAFVFVCLNDQMREGCGQTALLTGAHHASEDFFRWQRAQNDRIGPEGPGWPRLNYKAPNHCGHVYLPEMVREHFIDETSESTPDGVKWPRPTQMLMEPGDACIALFHMPHSGTRNQYGTESRKNIIFRIRNKKQQPNIKVNGVSDHPDRGQMGEWLDYEEGNDPWARSKDLLCNQWDAWDGMQDIVAEESANRPTYTYG
jgi:ectoine hydroxylase-related dioxygenase (phytanoyl-CoA dioxygenase family)